MSRLRYNRRAAVRHLRTACPRMDEWLGRIGPFRLRVSPDADPFRSLARAIVAQQLSGKAANTIHGRFVALFGDGPVDAEALLAMPVESLRGAGLSRNKSLAIIDLAERCVDGRMPSCHRLASLDDGAVVERLTEVRGVGPWTAQMHLMFVLGRPDVMPATDLGVQKGVQRVYTLDALPAPEVVSQLTAHLAPFRSAASWYFWRAADTELVV